MLDSDGSPLSGVTVTLVQISATPAAAIINPINSGAVATTPIAAAPVAPSAATTASAISAKDGTFLVPGLAKGLFAVCVKDPAGAVTDPCLWTGSRTTVNVAAATLSSGLVVRAKKASLVSIRVNNTGQALMLRATDARPPHVLVGAFDSRGVFHPAIEVHRDATGISYQLAIPVDSPIRMTVYSAQVKLADNLNVALPAPGYATTFVQPSGQLQAPSFVFNAVGRK